MHKTRIATRSTTGDWLTTLLVIGAIVLQLATFLYFPVGLQEHHFREAQTAVTVQEYLNYGYALLNYRTPVFGPPWQVPMEFPVYQTSVYLLMRLFGLAMPMLEFCCRLVSLGWFFLSAGALFLVCRQWFTSSSIPKWILVFYLYCPFNLYWAKGILPDFCSVFFGLVYIWCFLRWLDTRHWAWPLAGTLAGSFGYLAKSTSMFLVVFFLAFLILFRIYSDLRAQNLWSFEGVGRYIRGNLSFLTLTAALCVLPVIPGLAWTAYSDAVKEASPYTAWITSEGLSDFNMGFESMWMLDYGNWHTIFYRIQRYFVPFLAVLLLPVGLFVAAQNRENRRDIALLAACFSGVFGTLFLLNNLYMIHSYYLIALSPFLCIAAGYGLYAVFQKLLRRQNMVRMMAACLMGVCFLQPTEYVGYLLNPDNASPSWGTEYYNAMETVCGYIDEITRPDEPVIVGEDGWSSYIAYRSNRRVFMLNSHNDGSNGYHGDELVAFLKDNGFTTLVTANPAAHEEILAGYRYLVQMDIQSVSLEERSEWYFYRLYDDEDALLALLDGRSAIELNATNFDAASGMTTDSGPPLQVENPEVGGSMFFLWDRDTIPAYVNIHLETDAVSLPHINCVDAKGEIHFVMFQVVPGRQDYIIKVPSDLGEIDKIGFGFPPGEWTIKSIRVY